LFAAMFLLTGVGIALVLLGTDFRTTDVGDPLERTARVAQYSGERMRAAVEGVELPEPPQLEAEQRALQVALGATLISQVLVLAIVVILTRRSLGDLVRIFRLDRFSFDAIWRPALAVVAAYTMVAIYAVVMELLDIEILQPTSTVPTEITRDNLTLALAAAVIVIGAPISEELFFRGFVFSGLLKWGFWPAAAVSAILFTLFHLDPGSVIPFTIIGIVLAWLYYSRGSLWDSITFHFLFNFTSFMLLLAAS
jgi:uncharacterized protein